MSPRGAPGIRRHKPKITITRSLSFTVDWMSATPDAVRVTRTCKPGSPRELEFMVLTWAETQELSKGLVEFFRDAGPKHPLANSMPTRPMPAQTLAVAQHEARP